MSHCYAMYKSSISEISVESPGMPGCENLPLSVCSVNWNLQHYLLQIVWYKDVTTKCSLCLGLVPLLTNVERSVFRMIEDKILAMKREASIVASGGMRIACTEHSDVVVHQFILVM